MCAENVNAAQDSSCAVVDVDAKEHPPQGASTPKPGRKKPNKPPARRRWQARYRAKKAKEAEEAEEAEEEAEEAEEEAEGAEGAQDTVIVYTVGQRRPKCVKASQVYQQLRTASVPTSKPEALD